MCVSFSVSDPVCLSVFVCVVMCACVRAYVRARERARVCLCVCMRACVRAREERERVRETRWGETVYSYNNSRLAAFSQFLSRRLKCHPPSLVQKKAHHFAYILSKYFHAHAGPILATTLNGAVSLRLLTKEIVTNLIRVPSACQIRLVCYWLDSG